LLPEQAAATATVAAMKERRSVLTDQS